MVDRESPLGTAYRPGSQGAAGNGVTLSELKPGTIIEAASWPGKADALAAAIGKATGLSLSPAPNSGAFKDGKAAAFNIAPGRFLVSGQDEKLAAKIENAIPMDVGTATDLSHGRTVLRIEGLKAEWVLAKLFALDFSLAAFPVPSGRATTHHDIFTQIHRTAEDRFDLYVFRSFARAFWGTLRHAAGEVGYTIK